MPVNTREFFNAVAILADEREMRVTVKESGKGAILCGTACFVGGILLGPVGLAAGGIAGALTAAHLAKGKFRSAGDILRNELTDRQREQLLQHIVATVADLQVTDLALFLPLLTGSAAIQMEVLRALTSFLSNELRLQVSE